MRQILLDLLQRSPLTDPRASLGSAAVHGLVLILAATVVVAVAPGGAGERPVNVIKGDLDPIDNRVSPKESGGAPGPEGGEGEVAVDIKGLDAQLAGESSLPESLRAMLPGAASTADPASASVPLPSAAGMGLVPGAGAGGGFGEGTGSRAATGPAAGPTVEFFGTRDNARSFAYVIDRSGSMARSQALDVAKAELLSSLDRIPADVTFDVVFYDLKSVAFADKMIPATQSNKERLRTYLRGIGPFGGTDHIQALRAGLALRPEVLFFLTDAELAKDDEVDEILRIAGETRIQIIEFGVGPDVRASAPLRRLGRATGGTYRYLDVDNFGKRPR
jgi:hypothetical protein